MTHPTLVLSLATLLSGLAYLVALAWHNLRARYILKPGTMLFIILLAATGLPEAGMYGWLVVLGLTASALGDVLLLPPDRLIPGMLAFLLAHLSYMAAFLSRGAAPLARAALASRPVVAAQPCGPGGAGQQQ